MRACYRIDEAYAVLYRIPNWDGDHSTGERWRSGADRVSGCVSNHVERARAMNADYRCPDCSALFDATERIVADPRRGRLDDRGPEQPEA